MRLNYETLGETFVLKEVDVKYNKKLTKNKVMSEVSNNSPLDD